MNNVNVIIGLQYGDEGKGKFTDLISDDYDYVVRYQGGDNAGHSIAFDNQKYSLRLIPSGIFKSKKVVIGNGCVVNPETLLFEIEYLKKNKFKIENQLYVSDQVHVIFDFNILMDKLIEDSKGNKKIGTTIKGIGPTYTDKYSRIGIRICDLFNIDILKQKLTLTLRDKNIIFKNYGYKKINVNQVAKKYYELGKKIKKYVCNTTKLLNEAINANKKILLEGAQGVLLDIDFGTYPYVTSSNVATGMSSGTGIGISKINNVLGIVKAYTSRVGEGPFCSEIKDQKIANTIREKGNEFGTVTKRPRRIGWIDLVALKYAIEITGATELAITLLDVLSIMDKIKICINYSLNSKTIDYIPSSVDLYSKCKPKYIEVQGWKSDISMIKKYDDLPLNCKKYLTTIQKILNVKISYVSVGPRRDQTIKVK